MTNQYKIGEKGAELVNKGGKIGLFQKKTYFTHNTSKGIKLSFLTHYCG
jgi:hypothetical protein